MPTPNLYWPVYKNLEREFLQLADYVHFSDDQVNVYSMHIADLIVRCAIEIEAISKELYSRLGGNMSPVNKKGSPRNLCFDADCIGLLEDKWHLSKKQISVIAHNFYFEEQKYKVLTPLYKANIKGASGSEWKQAYQAIKHDRKNSLSRATIHNLLHIMGALYILNLYYRDDKIDIGPFSLNDHNFDNSAGSEVFSAAYCSATVLALSTRMNDRCIEPSFWNNYEESVFIIKCDDESFKDLHQKCCAVGDVTTVAKAILVKNSFDLSKARKEAILNKHTQIYPDLFP